MSPNYSTLLLCCVLTRDKADRRRRKAHFLEASGNSAQAPGRAWQHWARATVTLNPADVNTFSLPSLAAPQALKRAFRGVKVTTYGRRRHEGAPKAKGPH